MKISRNWLQQFVDISDITNKEFSQLFNIRTAEIDGMESAAEQFEHMVIGEIKSIAPHPNADKLRITQTDIGNSTVQIVCGANNIKEGMRVIVALPGSKVRWHGEGDLIELKEAELRGVKSTGMICGADEVGLPNKVDGVADMSDLSCPIGTALAVALDRNDTVIEIDNKSLTNRPDLWGHYGIARECAVIWDRPLLPLKVATLRSKNKPLNVTVEEPKLCPRYMAASFSLNQINNDRGAASSLSSIGHNSHGLLVDLTNYIMHELGQPLHVFDAQKVSGNIVVRKAKANEKLVTLDKVERTLHEGMLVIADEVKVLAIAGVMGGLASAVTSDTKEIILESANFDPTSVRVTAQKLGLRTDAVQHYEKSLDPYLTETALNRFFYLLGQFAEFELVSGIADQFASPPKPLKFTIDTERIASRIGAPTTEAFITKTLKALGFEVSAKAKSELEITVPSYRATKDVSGEADIIEEIARLYGYEKIEPTLPQVALGLPPKQPWLELERKIKLFLAHSCHLNEVYHYSFYGPKELERFEFNHEHVVLKNSLSEEHTHLRTHLLPGMLDGLVRNSTLFDRIGIFEIGKTYLPITAEKLPDERTKIGIIYTDSLDQTPFIIVKSYVEALLKSIGIPYRSASYVPTAGELYMQKGRSLILQVGNQILGHVYELSSRIRSKYKVTTKVAFAELDFEVLLAHMNEKSRIFKPIIKFPNKLFDVSVVVSKDTEVGTILASLAKQHELIDAVAFLNEYTDSTLGEGKKALAFKFTLQAPDRTLTDQDMHTVQKLIFDHLSKKFNGVIRGL